MYLYRVMFKGENEKSEDLVRDRIYEFESKNINFALRLAGEIAKKKEWRVVLLAEVVSRIATGNWDLLKKEIEKAPRNTQ